MKIGKEGRLIVDLGEYTPCLNVKSIEDSINFYTSLGFEIISDYRDQKWAVVKHNNMVLSLFEGHIERNLINFRGGDIREIMENLKGKDVNVSKDAHMESDGSWSSEVIDPDGNVIYFNTFPDEREQYLKEGTVF